MGLCRPYFCARVCVRVCVPVPVPVPVSVHMRVCVRVCVRVRVRVRVRARVRVRVRACFREHTAVKHVPFSCALSFYVYMCIFLYLHTCYFHRFLHLSLAHCRLCEKYVMLVRKGVSACAYVYMDVYIHVYR